MKFDWKPKKQKEASLREETLWEKKALQAEGTNCLCKQALRQALAPWTPPKLFFPWLEKRGWVVRFYFILIDGAPCYVMWQWCIYSCNDKWWNNKNNSNIKWSGTTGKGVPRRKLLPWTPAVGLAGGPVEVVNSFTGISCLLATRSGRKDSVWPFLFLMCSCISLVVLGLSGCMQDLHSSLRIWDLFSCSIWNLAWTQAPGLGSMES